MNQRKILRDFQAGDDLDVFLVTAVAAILLIRLFLRLTGFPQLGGDTLHIAHMLWGGLLMLVAIIVLLSIVGRTGHKLAAVIGGAGFGMFIDEVGKFVTKDNDYFFQPSLSIIYILLILTYLAIRWIHNSGSRTQLEYLVNALQEAQQIAIGDLERDERDRALEYLDRCDGSDPLVAGLKRLMEKSEVVEPRQPDAFARAKKAAVKLYRRLVAKPWFRSVVVIFFISQLAFQLVHIFTILVFDNSWLQVLLRRPLESLGEPGTRISFFEVSVVGFAALSAVFVAAGAWQIRRSMIRAYQLFQRSILVSIFFIQPLMFYRDQWSALIGLAFDIAVFLALRFIIEREQLSTSESIVPQEVDR